MKSLRNAPMLTIGPQMECSMRLVLSLLLVAASLTSADAQTRTRKPLRLTVTPRSYLEPGNVVPVGSLQNYATFNLLSPPSTAPQITWGESNLPPRIGGGRNPFGPVDWGGPASQ